MCEKDICTMAGVKEVEILEVKRPIIEDILSDIINTADNLGGLDIEKGREMSKRVCSYILLDVEKEKFEKVYPVLRLNDQVVYCDFTSGKYNLVLFVQGSYFNEIDRFIEDKISDLDGVLKIKEFPIVNMFDM
ncbi:MAG: Lrp/AsnC ligand binding domain-containing protein [Bacteroidota bacterium]